MPSDDVPRRMLVLLLELLRSDELADDDGLLIGGVGKCVSCCLMGRLSLGPTALECGIIAIVVAQLRAIGSPADWVSLSRGKALRAGALTGSLAGMFRSFHGQAARPDLTACVSSGLFEIAVEAVAAFAAAGVGGLGDTDHMALYFSLSYLKTCRAEPGGCEAKVRSVAHALAFCLEHSLDVIAENGMTTQGAAVQVCCGVFGRDEGGSEFSFSQPHIDILLTRWSQIVRAEGYNRNNNPTADTILALDLCISDENKPLLLNSPAFIPYLVDALLIDPSHPRAEMKEELKVWCQTHHTECFAQLAVFAPACEALRQDPSVISALEAVVEVGLSAQARDFAQRALLALSDKELQPLAGGEQLHIMISYQWDGQTTVQRINESLIARGYVTWFDLTDMKGSTMDAMR